MNRYSDGSRKGRRPTAPSGIWGSPEFLFGITRGSYRDEPSPDRQGVQPAAQAVPVETPAAQEPWLSRLARQLSRWLRLRGRAAATGRSVATKVAPAE